MVSLLDVNVLIALLDENHLHHNPATNWFSAHVEACPDGWASCAITQNGCLRVIAQPRYPNALALGDARGRLQEATSTTHHRFLKDDVSLLDDSVVDARHILGHRQLTDIYLLALAVAHGGRLVTLDKSVPLAAVHGATQRSLEVI